MNASDTIQDRLQYPDGQPNDGGPAFPHTDDICPNGSQYYPGMTLRDWFAGQAMAGLLANPEFRNQSVEEHAMCALWAADAMLAERAKATGKD